MPQTRIDFTNASSIAHALVLISVLAAGCGGDTVVRLAAVPEEISAGGIDVATITATSLIDGSPAPTGTKVEFETTAGSFARQSAELSATVATDSSGVAKVSLYSSAKPETATVTASFYDDTTGLSASSSVSVRFVEATGRKSPVDGTFRMTCNAVNIGALIDPLPDIRVICQLQAQTRTGQLIPTSAMAPQFLTEAGGLSVETDGSTGEQQLVYSPRSGASAPKDVKPDVTLNEPSYLDGSGLERNPRDGLATLVAVVDGEEAFTDKNGNGVYDPGEPFVDAAEPFADLDDDDLRDADEPFVDSNGNGTWDKANGKWDEQTKIMAVYKILWTGIVHNSQKTSRIARPSTTISDGGKIELRAYVLDANQNPVAAFQPAGDALEWTLTTSGSAVSHNDTAPPMDNQRGFEFDKAATTERARWKILSNSFAPRPYSFTVEDDTPGDQDPAASFSVTLKVKASPGPTGAGSYVDSRSYVLEDTVNGTCD